ncbi:uncharacterized protein LOC141608138 [Silene latifolia]|uniref:uncharacterized protein LOC141608138 n=1 Tax=Silene latifolia TaxID=37657 RepID=UPI003D76C68E
MTLDDEAVVKKAKLGGDDKKKASEEPIIRDRVPFPHRLLMLKRKSKLDAKNVEPQLPEDDDKVIVEEVSPNAKESDVVPTKGFTDHAAMARSRKSNKNPSLNLGENSQKNGSASSIKGKGKAVARHIKFSSLDFESDLESIIEEEEEHDIPISEQEEPVESAPVIRLTQEDVAGEISYWSTSVYCYILEANPPSNVISGFVKRVWQANRVDRVSFLPNGIFLVRFTTKEQQKNVLQNGHLIFDNKPVIVNEWKPDSALLKHDVSKIPLWMKIYGLDIKFLGVNCLTKLCGNVGKYIKCDEATTNKTFMGFARIMVEVTIGQQFPDSIQFFDENGNIQRARIVYDWLPTTCSSCKRMGHIVEVCRKGNANVGQKVWKPKAPAQKTKQPQPLPTTPVLQRTTPPGNGNEAPVLTQYMPRRFISRCMKGDNGGKKVFTPGGLSFMKALSLSIQKSKAELIERNKIKWFLNQNKVGLFGLLETKIRSSNWQKDITAQCIHSKDKNRRINFWLTVVYGLNKAPERECLWLKLGNYYRKCQGPWMVYGDFNAIMAPHERIGGATVTNADVQPLIQTVQECELYELKGCGSYYTWNNKHEVDEKVYSKIDRVFHNEEWLATFPSSYANFLPEGLYDHCPCIINFEETVTRSKAPFKYYNMWSMAEGFENVITRGWEMEVQGTPMFKVMSKLKGMKKELRKLNAEQFSDIENLTKITELSLNHFQTKLRDDPFNEDLCLAERACSQELEFLNKARLEFLRQKSKEAWLKEGDDNTSYFHASIKKRRARNKVYQVKDMRGKLCNHCDDIKNAFEEYYISLLGTSKSVEHVKVNVVKQGQCLTMSHSELLLAPASADEVKTAMFAIPGTKAPGPDGFSSQFFKDCWSIVGQEVTLAIQSVFHNGKLLKQCNNTVITLVPKMDVPDSVVQFRPIACCNTIYKCISKIICNRLSTILPDVISPSQSAFIKGRDIVGNILICQDLIRMYKRKTCSPRMLMKLDMQKAYDSIEWSFVEEMLRAMGFPEKMVLLKCVSTPSYSIALNGEVFDDLILFCKGDRASIELMVNAFNFFSKASGLQLNKGKSNFYFNGVDEGLVQEVERATGMCRGSVPFRYLGVNVSPKRLYIMDCNCLVDKVVDRIRRMGSRQLSYAGRVVLIKSVLSTLHSYWARIFILPKTVIRNIEAICRDYLWHGKDSGSKPALVAWGKICRSKKKGGLGIKDLLLSNCAAVGKYVWWIEKKEDHLWVKWVHAIYIKGTRWKDYEPPVNSSWAWRKICQTKNILKDCIWSQSVSYSISLGYNWLVSITDNVDWYAWQLNNWILPKHGFI